jgi:hypothetical protein
MVSTANESVSGKLPRGSRRVTFEGCEHHAPWHGTKNATFSPGANFAVPARSKTEIRESRFHADFHSAAVRLNHDQARLEFLDGANVA